LDIIVIDEYLEPVAVDPAAETGIATDLAGGLPDEALSATAEVDARDGPAITGHTFDLLDQAGGHVTEEALDAPVVACLGGAKDQRDGRQRGGEVI